MSSFKNNKVAWGIAGGVCLGVIALIIVLVVKHKKSDTNTNPNTNNNIKNNTQPSPPPSNPSNKPSPNPPPSPLQPPCLYELEDCSQHCSICKGAKGVYGNDIGNDEKCYKKTVDECEKDNDCALLRDSPDLLNCLNCYLDQDPTRTLDGGQCQELLNAANNNPDCTLQYNNLYKKSKCSTNNPINNNNNRNHYPCGQDCSAPDASKCYMDFLNNNKCEFAGPHTSGNSHENCVDFADSNGLPCYHIRESACTDVLKIIPVC
jgi:hypothetical protein